MFGKALAALSAASLMVTPAVAQESASAEMRTAAPVEGAESMAGGQEILGLVGFLVVFGAIVTAVIVTNDDDDDVMLPTSP